MRLTKLFVALCVTAMAFALFGANARAATLAPGQPQPYTAHVDDNTVFVGIMCGDELLTPNTCPREQFTTTTSGTVTATANYPTGNRITLVLCAQQNPDLTPTDNCPNGTEVTSCVQTDVENPDGTTTSTLTCANVPAGSYELEIIPTFVATCPVDPNPLDPPCFQGPGITVSGTITLSGGTGGMQGGGGGTGGGSTLAKVTGGGKVNTNQETFAIEGFNADLTKGKVMYKNNKACSFRSTQYTLVQVTPTATGGSAHIEGKGVVNDGKNDTPVTFSADAQDNGEGSQTSPDQFVLKTTAPSCNTAGNVVNGNVQVHPSQSA